MYRVATLLLFLILFSCQEDTAKTERSTIQKEEAKVVPNLLYGIDQNQYQVETQKIKRGDTFGKILEDNGIDYPHVFNILEAIKGKVSVRKLTIGKSYSLFFSKDSIPTPEYFVYHPGPQSYTRIHLRDSLYGEEIKKPVRLVEIEASGIIESSLYETMQNSGINEGLTYYLSDVYAWTVDFFRLQKGDRFKVVYTEKFVDDTLSIGIERIKAAYFEHQGKPLYAFEYISDPEKGIVDYFDDEAKSLRRAFLQGPLKFNRISSRYNLKRRIAYYGNRIRPHKGTDFAAAVGTPILATANGTVVKASYTRGNGNYVTIKHNNVYSTQYLHMKKRKVKVGQFVAQGDVIGWVGMTGNTSGPHVCYRFWKNGKQVDPFKQKLPDAKPISKELKAKFAEHIIPYKTKLDCITFHESKKEVAENNTKANAKDPS
ncbi:peptidoglycan DD-metalloendopeptidase family protein [Flavobacteriaceae bacterium]|jgi:murein DD-endopeptidase MepM/ murein hydrolase activator NlpD|nr:peptidoglycan DD-metalloendopeptidase family protein [Flavobacteriaceae bacterium]MDA8644667.1 peptidoglycan DD-metalloendopeptidase family protein [Flavobacteriaceae bacterium]MDA9037541.1 peptidoglycan DD-metalloendopeptidase family protein [Flavobacteriaceae bacterium]MDC0386348.1 peptidoglycan DD-metalloendopeptidase family protein [Flavobacteriaceae bacterium]